MRFTSRLLAALAALLAAAALGAAAAQAGTQVRQFESFGVVPIGAGPDFPRAGDIALDFIFKNKRAGGKYTPRRLTRVRLSGLPLRCQDPGSPANTEAVLSADLTPDVKVTKATPPAGGKPKPNRYAFRFAWDFGGFASGYFSGTIDKAGGKGWPRAHGKFEIERYDFPPPGPTHCATSGQASWSAKTQCKRPGQKGELPLCRFD